MPIFKKICHLRLKKGIQLFPASLILGFSTMVWHILVINFDLVSSLENLFFKLEIIFWFAVASFFGLELFYLNFKKNRLLSYLILTALLVGAYFIIPENLLPYHLIIIFALSAALFLTALLAVSFKNKNFCPIVLTVALRFIASYALVGMIQSSVSIGVLAIGYLFNLDIPNNTYLYLFIFFANFCAYAVFLTTLSEPKELINGEIKALKGLELLGKYFFLPVSFIYLIILYIYSAQILITANWPKGLVSYLIISACAIGVFTTFLMSSFLKEKIYQKIFKVYYALVIPLTGILFWAIKMRFNDYGLTEKRYYVVLGGLWLVGISFYFIISHKMNVKMINYSLIILLLISIIGPWSSYSLSRRSQINRLNQTLEQGIESLKKQKKQDLLNNTNYLINFYGEDAIAPSFDNNIENFNQLYQKKINLGIAKDSSIDYILLACPGQISTLDTADYNHLYLIDYNIEKFDYKNGIFNITQDGRQYTVDFTAAIQNISDNYETGEYFNVDSAEMILETENAKFYANTLEINPSNNDLRGAEGYLLTTF